MLQQVVHYFTTWFHVFKLYQEKRLFFKSFHAFQLLSILLFVNFL